ncbi:TPA: KpsF/GutQ family sugar-phosphate isomerase [Aeromonas hydrophila]|uniref:KpsF/GutQ family sugar-phosphate isomerase n=1 Tax=Aeromonas TaxID=642 RepID=UPI00090AC070|nr:MULTISPECIES: KpsF/GutQ family sugar-phosphate isomerase [Aeromonas]HEB4991975.1 KpsF/GutQ family sugar-phosphate isomerase [Aeromonas hydrophila subsp. hydrophila]APJ17104.1 D-arabinose 5-phosphate isomerase [Aeromonas hydrophila]EIS3744090.1 KpsF/GutQ family sugar-phosphate isomerase [Aeromonas hydrophila]MCK0185796.1 KpsF/GutQ family sugar-phosphate isomerase [Aeromonas hydrophila]MCP3324045.1 KpsF/GutQ family sugar-phosphate isomerase [Aeromonas hydrophila]
MSVKSEKVSELFDFRRSARTVLDIEKQAIDGLYQYLNDAFDQACEMILRCSGKIVVTGMGKSGHVGSKIAATLASTGTPAFFLHPGEASHGDLGMISGGDLIIAISNSGESDEILALLPVLKRRGIPLICMTGNPVSTMAKEANVHLCIKVEKEACPLGLAPTSSTTATLVMGDALAVALLEARGFTADDFALSHPGGSLGKRLLLRVGDLMHSGELLPQVGIDATISQALLEVSRKGLGMTAVADADGRLAGLFTDGDLRRILDLQVDIHHTPISRVMTVNCVTVGPEMMAAEAVKLMETRKINGLLVVDGDKRPLGAFNMHDLLKAGVI